MSSTHAHSHGPDPDAPPPTEEALGRRRRAVWLMLLILVPAALATVIGLVALWPDGEPTRAEQAATEALPPGTTYPDGRVASVEPYDCGIEGRAQTCATAVVEILDGDGAGDFVQLELDAVVVANGVEEGDTLVLTRDAAAEGGAAYLFYDFARDAPMITLAIVFAVVVGLVARLRGLASLLGLAFAFFILLRFVLPGLLGDTSPVLVTLVGSAAIMFVVLYLAHGFSARTTTALVGTLFGLTLVAVMGALSVATARLTGLTSEETVTLQGYDPTLDFSGLVLAGIVVAGLGVLNDVTITQASAIWQLHEVDPSMTWRELYTRGMTVGRDHIASTVYTIVFAYAGAALPLLLLFEVYSQPWNVVLTSSALAEEVIRTMVGAIALVLAVPVTTAAGAFFAKAADTQAGAATERSVTALRARFAR
ncbi:YibE/F family protein [Blastococcus saxobsidens]|uniref:Putative multitransmembrane protein, YibE/F-like family n=1 Tax=Blastococcus saxobsidens (strain DD2) TaxID=1146883 RepID=H6RS24_BLASD|nr:YibE/F family protein [Blastococcus saxobsidens]CCG04218.1 putative multitransmembrane protein, YibE/F-like family [Blastococcus saxobsidens DD2]